MDTSGPLPQLLPSPRLDDTRLDVLDYGAERREVLNPIDRDELTGDLVGQEAALLDVTAPIGLDVLATIGHGFDRLRGPLLHADGRWRLVSIGIGTPTIIDPDHFGNVAAVADASHGELQAVDGIGPMTADRITPKSTRLRWIQALAEPAS